MKSLYSLLVILFLITACSREKAQDFSEFQSVNVEDIFETISLSEELNLYVDEEGQPAEGRLTASYEDGSLRADVTFSEGMISEGGIFRPDGSHFAGYTTSDEMMKYTIYFTTGDPNLVTLYGDDLADRREFHVWQENGQRLVEFNQSMHRMWHENGWQSLEVPAIDGKTHGRAASWYENGQIKSEYHFINGDLDGTYMKWDEDGNLIVERVYELGELVSDN